MDPLTQILMQQAMLKGQPQGQGMPDLMASHGPMEQAQKGKPSLDLPPQLPVNPLTRTKATIGDSLGNQDLGELTSGPIGSPYEVSRQEGDEVLRRYLRARAMEKDGLHQAPFIVPSMQDAPVKLTGSR